MWWGTPPCSPKNIAKDRVVVGDSALLTKEHCEGARCGGELRPAHQRTLRRSAMWWGTPPCSPKNIAKERAVVANSALLPKEQCAPKERNVVVNSALLTKEHCAPKECDVVVNSALLTKEHCAPKERVWW